MKQIKFFKKLRNMCTVLFFQRMLNFFTSKINEKGKIGNNNYYQFPHNEHCTRESISTLFSQINYWNGKIN